MRIIIDLQAAQCSDRENNIHAQRSIELSKEIAKKAKNHEVLIALNGALPANIEKIRSAFDGIIDRNDFCVWECPEAIAGDLADILYEGFIRSLSPDTLIVTHLFAGLNDRCVCSFEHLRESNCLISVLLDDQFDFSESLNKPREQLWQRKKRLLQATDLFLTASIKTQELLIKNYSISATNVIESKAASEKIIFALETAFKGRVPKKLSNPMSTSRQRLAYISPLPPTKSGIAEYSAILIPALAKHYDIDVITSLPDANSHTNISGCQLKSVEWFHDNAFRFDRVLYHFGNSGFHTYMFELIRLHPGVVVLHDFFLGHVVAIPPDDQRDPYYWRRLLRDTHGYQAVLESLSVETQADSVWKYPANADVLQNSLGVIVHSEHARQLAKEWYGETYAENWSIIPLVRRLNPSSSKQNARSRLGYKESDYLICSFGAIGGTKKNLEALRAWIASALARRDECFLCFVGWDGDTVYLEQLRELICCFPHSRVRIVSGANPRDYQDYLSAADCAIQLRARSRGETSAAALDCIAAGVPMIVNANGSLGEIPNDVALIIEDDFSIKDLTVKIEEMFFDQKKRLAYGSAALRYAQDVLSPHRIAGLYRESIETFYHSNAQGNIRRNLISRIAQQCKMSDEPVLEKVSECVVYNHRSKPYRKRIFVDITEVAKNDLKTGVERVVRNIIKNSIEFDSIDYIVMPVYFDPLCGEGAWRHASEFMGTFYLGGYAGIQDDVVEIYKDDIFVMLDLTYASFIYFYEQFLKIRNRGAKIYICVYDLLPIKLPTFFPSEAFDVFSSRLDRAASVADGLICISRTVAKETYEYFSARQLARHRALSIGWFSLGFDIMNAPVDMAPTGDHENWLDQLKIEEFILMVGTVEPRKGHADALSAFEILWNRGSKLRLVICGKKGWMQDALLSRIQKHPLFGEKLFWFEGASDYTLDILYRNCTGVLVASEGEGFGLPLVEAGSIGKPILARDIPVFREVAGDNATYFSGDVNELSSSITRWVASIHDGSAPNSRAIRCVNWQESARQFMSLILSQDNPGWTYKITFE